VTYAHKLTKEMEVIDPKKTCKEIDLQVRTLNPWPGTKIETISGLKVKIKKGKPSQFEKAGKTGQLLVHNGTLLLQCSDTAYEITELQEEGKKAVSAADFLNGARNRNLHFPMELKI
jgi:methionyl-tRNA formyltransferase